METERLDLQVRQFIYEEALTSGVLPTMTEVSEHLREPVQDVRQSFARLAAGRVLVLQRDSGEILMANPFSAVPTSFIVEFEDFACFANCIWDALGVIAMRGR